MVRIIAAFTVVLLMLASSVMPALSLAPEWEWKRPGTCRFDGTREDVTKIIRKFGLLKPVEERFVADFLASTLPLSDVIQEMKQRGANSEALASVEKQAGGRKFFTKAELQKLAGIPAVAMETLAKKISDTAAKPFKIKRGYRFQRMFNCEGAVRERGIYNPDPGWPEELEAIAFEYTKAGVMHRFVLPGICDNFTYEMTKVGLTLTVPVAGKSRSAAREYAEPGRPELVRVWESHLVSWKNSSPKAQETLRLLINGVSGQQSIDLGNEIARLLAKGEAKHYTGTCAPFRMEWHDISVEKFKKEALWVTQVPEDAPGTSKVLFLRPLSNTVSFASCNGVGHFEAAVPARWAGTDMSYTLAAPDGLLMVYPKGKPLHSAGKATRHLVTGLAPVLDPTISYRHSQTAGVTRLFFVVDDR